MLNNFNLQILKKAGGNYPAFLCLFFDFK